MSIKLSLNNTASAVKQNNLSNGKGKIKLSLSLGATETNAGGLGGGLKYLGSNLGAGAFGVLEGAYDFTVGGIADLFGADEYAKKLQENDISGQWQQKAAEKFNPSKGWEFAGQVASGVGQSAVGIGAAVLTGGSSLAAGATIGLGAAGKSTTAAYQQTGELGLKEYAYGAASGIIEVSLEALTGAAGKIGKRIASPTAKTLAKSTVRQGIVKTMLTEGAGEFVEEALSEYIDPYLLRATKINPEAENATAQEIVYAGMVGFVSGAILSGTTSTASNVSNISRGNKITAEGKTSTLLAKATELKEYTDTAIAESADSNLVATPLKQLTASVNAYDKLKNKDSLKGKMLLGEIQQGVAYVEMSQGVQTSLVNVKANAEALAQTEYFKNTYKDYTAADITANKDDIATKLAISDFAGKMLIPTEQYTAQIQAGQMAQGETQYNAWRESIDDKTAESVSKQLGIDIKTASYYEATKAVEDYNKSGKNIPTLPDKISLKVGDSTIYRLSDGRTVGIKRDKKGYYVAVNDANGKGIGKNNKAIAKNDIDDFIATLTAPKAVQKEQKALSDTEAENTTKTETATTEPQSETVQPLKKAQTASATVTARKYVKNFDMLDAATRGRIVEAIISGTQYGVNSTTLNAVANLLSVRKGLNISFSNIEANGLYTTVKKERFAVINPKLSDNMLRETILHELTHDLERTIGYTALQTTAVELADKADKKRITEQYTKYYEDNDLVKSASLIDEEITAHFFSQFMGQSDFISKYANEQLSTFQKAKKWISNLAEKLKNINNQAYRAAKQLETLYTSVVATKAENVDSESKYSLTDSQGRNELFSALYKKQEEIRELGQEIKRIKKSDEFNKELDEAMDYFDTANTEELKTDAANKYNAICKKYNIDQNQKKIDELRKEVKAIDEQIKKIDKQKIAERLESGENFADTHRKNAVKEFGYTPFFYDAGYVLPNGKMLNFSGEKGKHFGVRGQDHREISTIFENGELTSDSASAGLIQFINEGNIRIMPEAPGVDISSTIKPTSFQLNKIRDFVKEYVPKNNYFNVDFTNEKGNTVATIEYDYNVKDWKVISDIKYYYENGKVPQQSEISKFRYSLPDTDSQGRTLTKEQAEFFKDSKVRDEQGRLLEVYHGTNEDFNVFDSTFIGMASGDSGFFGKGFYFAYSKGEASFYGSKRLISAYLNLKNPFNFQKNMQYYNGMRTLSGNAKDAVMFMNFARQFPEIAKDKTIDVCKQGDNEYTPISLTKFAEEFEKVINTVEFSVQKIESTYGAEWAAFADKQTKKYLDHNGIEHQYTDYEYQAKFYSQEDAECRLYNAYSYLENNIYSDIDMYSFTRLILDNNEEFTQAIKDKGYDGIIQSENGDEAVAFHPNQIKSITNLNPTDNEDIRYSLTRDTMMTKMPTETKPTRAEKMFEGWTNFQIAFVNEQAGVENALKAVGVKNGEALTNFVRSANKAGEEMLAGNQYSASGKYQGEGLSKIFAPVLAKGEAYEQSFYDYLANYHNIDRLKQGKPVNAATAEQSNDIIESYDQTNPEFKAIAEKLWQYNRNLLQYRVDTGLITKELANSLNEMYPHYIPTFRNKDSQIGTGSLKGKFNIAVKSTIKTAKGSTSEILPIGVMMARQTLETIKAGRVNTLAKTLNDAAAKSSYPGVEVMNKQALTIENTEDADYTENKPNANKNEITFFDNGQRVTMRVSKDIFAGFNAFSPAPKVDNIVFKGLRKVNATFKRLVTSLNPAFLVRNTVRDLQDAGLYTKYGTAFIGNYKEAINQIKTDGEYWKLYRAMGGFTSSVFDFEKGFVGAQNRFGLTKAEGNVLSKGLTALENANAFVEQLPRLAEFMSSIQAGNSVEQALLDSADITVNFGRSGNITKKLNSTIMPFLNPAIQGFDKIIRTLTGARTKKAITSLIIKAAVVGILPQLLNQLMYDDDEDYALLRDTDKENNYLFKIGDKFIKIPKGRVVSVFSGLVNRVSQTAKGEEDVWEGYGKNVLSQITPVDNLSRTVLSPFSDVKNNLTWYGTAIEGREFEAIEPKNRYDEKTSIIAIALGKVLNYSPKKIHYLLDQYSGVIGDFILPATTSAAEKDFLSGNFTIDPVNSNRLSNKFYKLYDETNYAKSNGDTTAAYKMRYLNKIKSAVSELYNEKSAIQASNLTDKEKIAETKTIQTLINEAYKTALADIELMGKAIEATEGIDENLRYTEATRLMYGAERALREYDKSVYAKAQSMNAAGIDYDTYYLYYFGTKTLTAETNANGDTINGSKKTNVLKYIASLKIPTVQKYLLVLNSGYVINDGDIKNVSKKQAYLTVAEYIAKLKISTSDKAELAERLGLTVKNNKIIV